MKIEDNLLFLLYVSMVFDTTSNSGYFMFSSFLRNHRIRTGKKFTKPYIRFLNRILINSRTWNWAKKGIDYTKI